MSVFLVQIKVKDEDVEMRGSGYGRRVAVK